ncbi:unnamed protein product [Lactuca saligna]|uniref:Uncharacterized protein n=1 Tax=Lactuca saligna TaxID=75948 RepID=A0AA35YP47_LACSI|nr:unnamed protein product [Lactuca saligna]
MLAANGDHQRSTKPRALAVAVAYLWGYDHHLSLSATTVSEAEAAVEQVAIAITPLLLVLSANCFNIAPRRLIHSTTAVATRNCCCQWESSPCHVLILFLCFHSGVAPLLPVS